MNDNGTHGDTRTLRYGDCIRKGDRGGGGRADPPHVRLRIHGGREHPHHARCALGQGLHDRHDNDCAGQGRSESRRRGHRLWDVYGRPRQGGDRPHAIR